MNQLTLTLWSIELSLKSIELTAADWLSAYNEDGSVSVKKNWSRDLKMSNSFGSCNLTYVATYEIYFSWNVFCAPNSRSSLNERIIFSLCLLPLNKMREVMAENYFLCEK